MKKFLLLGLSAMLAIGSLAVDAPADVVLSFGAADPTPTQTINRVAQTGGNGNNANVTVANLLDTGGILSGISSTGAGPNNQWFSAGGGGTYAPLGGTTYDDSNTLVNGWKAAYDPTNLGNIWQQTANGDNDPGSTLTFAGLAANTAYNFQLLSVRANGFLTDSGTYALNYNGGSAGVSTTLDGTGTLTVNSVDGSGTGSVSGLNAREINWSFSTDGTPGDAVLGLTGDWNVNAILITSAAVPEPTSAALLGLGLAGMACVRRRKK